MPRGCPRRLRAGRVRQPLRAVAPVVDQTTRRAAAEAALPPIAHWSVAERARLRLRR